MVSWSFSSYSAALKCLQYYKNFYIDKLIIPQNSVELAFGTSLHAGLTDLLEKGPGNDAFHIWWETYKNKNLDYKRFSWTHYKDLGLEFLRKFKKGHLKHYEPKFAFEERLFSNYRQLKLNGVPDFIGTYKGKKAVLDFKTSGYNYDVEKQDIALQLYLYAYLVIMEKDYFPETLGYIVFNKQTGSIQTLTWDFDIDKMLNMLDDLADYCKHIETKETFPKNPNACMMYGKKCEYFDKCWGKKT